MSQIFQLRVKKSASSVDLFKESDDNAFEQMNSTVQLKHARNGKVSASQ